MLFLHQTSLGKQAFLVPQHYVALQVPPILVPKPGWLTLFLLMLFEDELRLYQLGGGAHFPIIVLPTQWRLCDSTIGHVVLLRV
jgi:hypothetical protein